MLKSTGFVKGIFPKNNADTMSAFSCLSDCLRQFHASIISYTRNPPKKKLRPKGKIASPQG